MEIGTSTAPGALGMPLVNGFREAIRGSGR